MVFYYRLTVFTSISFVSTKNSTRMRGQCRREIKRDLDRKSRGSGLDSRRGDGRQVLKEVSKFPDSRNREWLSQNHVNDPLGRSTSQNFRETL